MQIVDVAFPLQEQNSEEGTKEQVKKTYYGIKIIIWNMNLHQSLNMSFLEVIY
jgi:hypothetical protein